MYIEREIIDKDNTKFYSNVATDYIYNKENIELLFIRIGNYRVFKESKNINLNAKYIFDYNENTNEIIICENDKYAPIFEDNINIKILCGENGTGKTTLIRLLEGRERDIPKDFFILLKDKHGNYYANNANLKIVDKTNNEEKIILNNPIIKWSYIHQEQLRFTPYEPLPIGDIYIQEKSKFDYVFQKNLFTDYYISYYEFDKNINDIKSKITYLFNTHEDIINATDYEMSNYFKIYPLNYILFYKLSDNLFEDFTNSFRDKNKKEFSNTIDMMNYIVALFWRGFDTAKLDALNTNIRKFIFNEKYIENLINPPDNLVKNKDGSFTIVREKCEEHQSYKIENKLYPNNFIDLLKEVGVLIENNKFCDGRCNSFKNLHNSLFEVIPFDKKNGVGVYDLSAGERERLEITGNLIRKLFQIENNSILYEDDVCCCAHPNWSKNFLFDYLSILDKLKKLVNQKEKMTNIVISTHSPFVLSDVSKYHVEYLQKDEIQNAIREDTFAGNIGQMFNDTFFMHSTIGKCSEELLQDIINYIDTGNAKNERIKDKVVCEKIINSVGDKILKSLLLEKFKNSKRYKSNEAD